MRKNLAANAYDSLESCLSKTFLLDVQDSMRRRIRQLECQVGLTILLLKPGGHGSLFVEFRVR